MPITLRQIPTNGIDSHVGRYETRGFRVAFDYGAYSNKLDHHADPAPIRTPLTVDGRACVLVSWQEPGDLPCHTAIHFPLTFRPEDWGAGGTLIGNADGLTLFVSYDRPELRALAEQICRSIRFKKQRGD